MPDKHPNARNTRGFTLLELIISIAIVLVLATIAFTGIPKFRESANRSVCSNNLRQQLNGIFALAADNNNEFYWPANSSGDDSCPAHLYPNYIESLDVFCCPSTQNEVRNTRHPLTKKIADLQNNADNKNDPTGHSYEYFGYYGYQGESVRKSPRHDRAMPSRVVLILDGDDYATNNYPDEDNNHGRDGWNWAFADGHVEWVPRHRSEEFSRRKVVR